MENKEGELRGSPHVSLGGRDVPKTLAAYTHPGLAATKSWHGRSSDEDILSQRSEATHGVWGYTTQSPIILGAGGQTM